MNIGIMLDSLGPSQLSYGVLSETQKLILLDQYIDPVIFYNTYDKPLAQPSVAMMQEKEVCGFRGPVIATDISSAEKLINAIGPSEKYFYVWELEWTTNNSTPYSYFRSIYQHDDIKLLARSQDHAHIISQCWKPVTAILEDFNHAQIARIIRQ